MCLCNIRLLIFASISYVHGHNILTTTETQLFDSIMYIILKPMLILHRHLGPHKMD